MLEKNILRDILELSGEIILLTDMDYNFLLINYEFENIIGLSKKQILKAKLTDFIKEKKDLIELSQIPKTLTFISKSGEKYPFYIQHVTRDHYLPDKKKAILWIGVPKASTELKKFQKELIRLNRMAEVGQLASGIVHELRNPLAIINQASGWGKTLISDNKEKLGQDGDELERVFEEIESQTIRCRDITDELLNFVREPSTEKKEFSPIRLIESTLTLINADLKSPKIIIEKKYEHRERPIKSDFRIIQQILINLLSNAIYAIREKSIMDGKITIITQDQGNMFKIIIKDNGKGISQKDQEKIFDIFFTTKPRGQGTGLGLALCRDIISKLGGEIGFSSKYMEGSEFYITFPINGS